MEDKVIQVKQSAVYGLGFLNMMLFKIFGGFLPLLYLSAAVMLFDLISRIYAVGMRDDEKVESSKIMKGFGKKFGLLLLIILALFIDQGIKLILELLGLRITSLVAVTAFTMAWIFTREAISIAENLAYAGVNIPPFIIKALTTTREKIDSAADDLVNGGGKS